MKPCSFVLKINYRLEIEYCINFLYYNRDMFFSIIHNPRYVSKAEADIMEKAISDAVSLQDEDFLDFLSAFDCKKAVNEENISDVLVELAHKELVQKPKYVADCWEGILKSFENVFPYSRSTARPVFITAAYISEGLPNGHRYTRNPGRSRIFSTSKEMGKRPR